MIKEIHMCNLFVWVPCGQKAPNWGLNAGLQTDGKSY